MLPAWQVDGQPSEGCNQTLWNALTTYTNTYHSLLNLKAPEFNTVAYLNNTMNVATVFAPTDTAMLSALRTMSGTTLSTTCLIKQIQTINTGSSEDVDALLRILVANASTYNSVALFNVLPDVAWSKDWLVHMGTGLTGLSLVTGQNYSLDFGKTSGKVRQRCAPHCNEVVVPHPRVALTHMSCYVTHFYIHSNAYECHLGIAM